MILALGLTLAILAAQEPVKQPVQLEVHLSRGADEVPVTEDTRLYLGEVVVCQVDLRIDAAYLEEQVVSRWRRPMDLQFELHTPWLEQASGYRVLENSSTREGERASL
ncbi:MAG: hypothetical protein ACPG31_13585, partial [Planctomycetota bacterium]